MKYYFMFDDQNDVTPLNKLQVKDEALYNQIIGSLQFTVRIFLGRGSFYLTHNEIVNAPLRFSDKSDKTRFYRYLS